MLLYAQVLVLSSDSRTAQRDAIIPCIVFSSFSFIIADSRTAQRDAIIPCYCILKF